MVSTIVNDYKVLFDPQARPEQVPLLQARLNLRVIAIKEYSTFSKAPGLEPHYQMLLSILPRTLVLLDNRNNILIYCNSEGRTDHPILARKSYLMWITKKKKKKKLWSSGFCCSNRPQQENKKKRKDRKIRGSSLRAEKSENMKRIAMPIGALRMVIKNLERRPVELETWGQFKTL